MVPRLVRGRGSRLELRALSVRRPAYDIVFLDRDGTINERRDGGYIDDPDGLVLLPGAAAAIAQLSAGGSRVVVVTNQRGLATGALTWTQWYAVSARLESLLAAEGAHIDATWVCPHDHGECACRKPAPGLFLRELAQSPWADPTRCAMIGDMPSDVAPAADLGMATVLLGDGADSLADAVDLLLTEPPGACARRHERRCR